MKYLVLLIVLIVAVGIWRSRRASAAPATKRPAPPPLALPQDMLACAHCGVHVPQSDALKADGQVYCCTEHRQRGPA